jgi:hypothetical protein
MIAHRLRSIALASALVGALLFGGLSAENNPQPFAGIVTELSQFDDGLFVHLDLNGNGQGDLWVKVLSKASIQDEDGNDLSLYEIEAGSILIIVNYSPKDSYYESDQVTLIVPKADDKPFLGDVLQIEKDQKDLNALSVLLNVNGDQKGDTWLRVTSDTTLKDGTGNEISSDEIVVGAVMIAITFESKDSYLDLSEAVVVQTSSKKA